MKLSGAVRPLYGSLGVKGLRRLPVLSAGASTSTARGRKMQLWSVQLLCFRGGAAYTADLQYYRIFLGKFNRYAILQIVFLLFRCCKYIVKLFCMIRSTIYSIDILLYLNSYYSINKA